MKVQQKAPLQSACRAKKMAGRCLLEKAVSYTHLEWQAQDYHPVSDPTRLMPHQVIGEVCNQCGPEAVYVLSLIHI